MCDFRKFLAELESTDHVVKIKKPVDIKYELAAIQWRIEKDLCKVVFFENVKGYDVKVAGNLYLIPLRMGITPTIPMIEEMLSIYRSMKKPGILYPLWATNDMIIQMYKEIEELVVKGLKNPSKPKLRDDTPLTTTIKKDKINVLKVLPIPKYFKEDGGHYITTGVTIAKDPDSDFVNAGVYRIEVIDKDKLAMMVNVKRDLRSLLAKARRKNQRLEVAVAIGVRPEILIASAMSVPYGTGEFDVAGGIAEHPVDLTSGQTIQLSIPSDSEIVIEGFIDPQKEVSEGPFTEYDLLASRKTKGFLINVTAIRFRDDPIYHSLVCTSMEMVSLILPLGVTEMMNAKKFLREVTPNIKDVWMLPGVPGVGMAISIDKEHVGEPQEIIHALFAYSARLKRVIVVDDDIDIYDPFEVQWAIDTRVCYRRDVIILEATGEITDAARVGEYSVKMGIDATKKKEHPSKFERSDISQFENVNLNEILKYI